MPRRHLLGLRGDTIAHQPALQPLGQAAHRLETPATKYYSQTNGFSHAHTPCIGRHGYAILWNLLQVRGQNQWFLLWISKAMKGSPSSHLVSKAKQDVTSKHILPVNLVQAAA